MSVPPKAFKLKSAANVQPSQPDAAPLSMAVPQPAQSVPPPQNTSIPLKLKPALVPQPVPPPPAQPSPQIHLHPPTPQAATQHGNISQGRLIIHNRASIVPPPPVLTPVALMTAVIARPPQPPPPSLLTPSALMTEVKTRPPQGADQEEPISPPPELLMTLRSESVNKPEAPPYEISVKPASGSFVNVKPALQKTSVYDVPAKYQIPDMSEDLQKILENESENYKDQLQSFVDLCETLSKPGWQFADIADYIHMLVRTVNLDVLSIVLTAPSERGRFCKVISRGYKSAPGQQIIAEWQPAVTPDATVDWNKLMDLAADKNTKTCSWISSEGLQSVGYVPLHGSTKIYGFMFVGAYENKIQSVLASSLLELCGDRIGVILETRRSAVTLPDTAIGTVQTIKDQLSLLAGYLEVLKLSAKVSPGDVAATSEKCLKAVAECKKLVDGFAEELCSSTASVKNA